MNVVSFDQAALLRRLESLGIRSRVSFALACAERLFPFYVQFNEATGQGDPNALRMALDRLNGDLAGATLTVSALSRLISQCESLVPVEDDSWTDWSACAQNAAAATAYVLRCRLSGDAQDAVWAAVQAYEAADFVVTTALNIDFNVPGAEDIVEVDHLVQRELATQDRDLEVLKLGSKAN